MDIAVATVLGHKFKTQTSSLLCVNMLHQPTAQVVNAGFKSHGVVRGEGLPRETRARIGCLLAEAALLGSSSAVLWLLADADVVRAALARRGGRSGRIVDGHVDRSLAWVHGRRRALGMADISVLIIADPEESSEVSLHGNLRPSGTTATRDTRGSGTRPGPCCWLRMSQKVLAQPDRR